MNLAALRALARHILTHAESFEWSLQGFGMLRLHMAGDFRMHVWEPSFAVPGVSVIHDHLQWGLKSTVISGRIMNIRYEETQGGGELHHFVTLKPGYGTRFKNEPATIRLRQCQPEIYMPGESYSQAPAEIHQSIPNPGTVTIMQKMPTSDESARVFWPIGTQWVSAEPRIATIPEVYKITSRALRVMELGAGA